MFENIVVATDGSENSKRALEVGAKLAAACNGRLTVVHVAPTYLALEEAEQASDLPQPAKDEIKRVRDAISGFDMSIVAPLPAPQSAIEFLGNAVLDRANDTVRECGIKEISRVLAQGDAAEEIVAAAETAKADLIVIGSRGLSDLEGLVMGSVSHKVIHLAKCPCVTVK
ncbi:MAG: universal stress protein [Alphaproteobacteria bacterium]|nr:universal stress protein [Alphaproteobacteria bacterium]